MRLRITLAVGLLGAGLISSALLPINWEFVSEQFDPLAHMAGSGVSTVMFGLLLYYPLTPRLSLRTRTVSAFVIGLLIWSIIELFQTKIAYHGPEMSDMIANFEGVSIGVIVLTLLEWIIAKTERKSFRF